MKQVLGKVTVLALLVLAACSDSPKRAGLPSEPQVPSQPGPQLTAPVPGACSSLAELQSLATAAFGAGSPNLNSVRGKLDNLQHQLDIQNYAEAKARGYDIVEFTLSKWKNGGLPGGENAVIAFLNKVLCYAGIDGAISDADNSFIVQPSADPQTEVRNDGQAGITIPGGSLSTTTIITIAPATGLLHTKLDQYPGIFNFTSSTDINGTVTIGVCLSVDVPPGIFSRLQLGHDISETEFEVTPKVDPPPGLTCPTSFGMLDKLPRWLATIARALLPQTLSATTLLGGGIGGSAGKLSPFGPIDPVLSATGGTGGSAGKLAPPAMLKSGRSTAAEVDCSAPIGSPVADACRPSITVKTNNGTLLTDVPVLFEVPAVGGGGGQVASDLPGLPDCGAFGSSATKASDGNAVAGACWTLGLATGTNNQKVWATPQVGGDAPDGVTFEPETITFKNTANPPDHFVYTTQPGAGSNITAGNNIPVTVNVVDWKNTLVLGSNDPITLTLNQNTFSTELSTASANAVAGVATFSSLAINKAATGYFFTASSPAAANTTASNLFNVVAGPAAAVKTFMPPGPTEAPSYDYGSGLTPYLPVSPAPRVRVTDQYGNPVSTGTPVSWSATTVNGGAVDVGTGGTTGGDGTAQVASWILGDGLNNLTAAITGSEAQFTGSTPTGVSVWACSAGTGNAKTDVAPMSIPAPNGRIKEVTLWMTVTGQSNALSDYDATFVATLNSPTGTQLGSTTGKVKLRGDNGNQAPVTFTFPASIAKQAGNARIWFTLTIQAPPTRKPQIWYLNSTFKGNDPCGSTFIHKADGSVNKKGLSINVTN